LDCPPALASNISGSGLIIPLEFTTGHTELAFENDCEAPLNFLDCACGVCNGNISLPCRNDGECAAQAAGTCTSKGGGSAANRKPNGCDDVVAGCQPIGDDKGQCDGGAVDEQPMCDGVLRANGNPFIQCNDNSDCLGTDCDDSTVLPDGCGLCTLVQTKACFLDPIVDDGVPDTENPLLVTTFCIPPTTNFAINNTAGLPGPARVAVDMVTELIY
jgi:hypothetical protein